MRFIIEELCQLRRERAAIAIVFVRDGVGRGHRTGERDFDRLVSMTFEETHGIADDRATATKRRNYTSSIDHTSVTISACRDLHERTKIDALEAFDKSPNVMTTALFTVSEYIQPGLLLVRQRK